MLHSPGLLIVRDVNVWFAYSSSFNVWFLYDMGFNIWFVYYKGSMLHLANIGVSGKRQQEGCRRHVGRGVWPIIVAAICVQCGKRRHEKGVWCILVTASDVCDNILSPV